MGRDHDRISIVTEALAEANLDALLCALPSNVLLISGYWPVMGSALAVITEDGYVSIIAPEVERDLAEQGWADELSLFKPGSLTETKSLGQALRGRLSEAAGILGRGSRIGVEEAAFEACTYAGQYNYAGLIRELLAQVLPSAHLKPAGNLLANLRSVLTPNELKRLQKACKTANKAFERGAAELTAGLTENEAAAAFRSGLNVPSDGWDLIARAGGEVFCMSGLNSSKSYGGFHRSLNREILPGEYALVHCNSYFDGMWTNITRTYCVGEPDERQQEIYRAIFAAREAVLERMAPGVRAADVDRAARKVFEDFDYGFEFKHPLGHGVGFAGLDPYARPWIHPASKDVLKPGMVVCIEPALYFEGYGGVRHTDMVAVTEQGMQLLTPFQSRVEELVILSKDAVHATSG